MLVIVDQVLLLFLQMHAKPVRIRPVHVFSWYICYVQSWEEGLLLEEDFSYEMVLLLEVVLLSKLLLSLVLSPSFSYLMLF